MRATTMVPNCSLCPGLPMRISKDHKYIFYGNIGRLSPEMAIICKLCCDLLYWHFKTYTKNSTVAQCAYVIRTTHKNSITDCKQQRSRDHAMTRVRTPRRATDRCLLRWVLDCRVVVVWCVTPVCRMQVHYVAVNKLFEVS